MRLDLLLSLKPLAHMRQIGRQKQPHEFVRHPRRRVERAKGPDRPRAVARFLLKFPRCARLRRLAGLQGSRGQLPQVFPDRDAEVADQDDLARAPPALRPKQRQHHHRPGVADHLALDHGAPFKALRHHLEIKALAPVDHPPLADAVHRYDLRRVTTHAQSQTVEAPRGQESAPRHIVRLVDLYKAFGRQQVLRGVSCGFPEGRTTVVLGPSGAGKSVILKHIVGLIRPDSGEIWFKDQRVDLLPKRELEEVRKQIGYLFQHSALFDSMTVEENLAFPLREHTEMSGEERRNLVAEALGIVGLDGFQPKMPAELSGGQKKRVGLARAIILKPALMLYDEPTTGLDPVRADGINELILKLRRDMGVSGIVVTHDLASARKVADWLVMLYEGKIIAEGTFKEIAASTQPEVRRFFGGLMDPRADSIDAGEWAPR